MVISRVTHGSYIWKTRQAIDHLVVPSDLALINEDGEIGDCECFAGRSSAGKSCRHRPSRAAEFSHAVALGQRDFAVLDDRDRHAGNAVRLAQ